MKRLLITSLCVLFTASFAGAHYINLPVKWSQVPWDPHGTDWLSDHTAGQVVADDFMCEEPDPIVAVRWWGSYPTTTVRPDGTTGPFDISFHSSVGPHPTSLPGQLIRMYSVQAQEVFVGHDMAGTPVYRYDAYLTTPFDQWLYAHEEPEPGSNVGELFIDICKPTGEYWGWHEVVPPHPILDFAAVAPAHIGPWQSTSTDMAFELMIPEPATVCLLGLGALGLLRRKK